MKLFIYLIFTGLFGITELINSQTVETKWLHSIENQTALHETSKFISNTTSFVVIGIPVALLADGYLTDNVETIKNGWYVSSSLAVAGLFTFAAKHIFERKRPYVTYQNYIVSYSAESGYSFPSAHTSAAFGLATSLSIAYPEWYVIAPSMLWAGSVAYSRMNMGVHYPSDVFAGALLGAGSAWLTYKLNKWLNKPLNRLSKKRADTIH
jgi:membrane-associated phospholipid phosphatase